MGVLPFKYYRAKDQFASGLSIGFGFVGELPPDFPGFTPGFFFGLVLPFKCYSAKDQFALGFSFVFGCVGELPPDFPSTYLSC